MQVLAMSPQRHRSISKKMSLMLRHEPEKFGLDLDAHGFALLADVVRALRGPTEAEVRQVVRESDKQRYEISEESSAPMIRARYGHSAQTIAYEPSEPPEVLFHGTSRRALEAIRAEGLKSMARAWVHLSVDEETAIMVGKRHDARPVILRVRAGEAHRAGVVFHSPEPRVFLAQSLEPHWIEFPQ
jgi:putative RNA 2'-phosphotransferase